MTQKELIRKEIERRKEENMFVDHLSIGRYYEDRDLLAFIDSLPEEKQPEDLEGKQMIKELKERIVGLDNNGNPIAAAPPDIPMIVEKVNEIIRYINATQRK